MNARTLCAALLLLAATHLLAQPLDDARWDRRFADAPRTVGTIQALAYLDGDIVVAGNFTMIDDTPARNLARWDSSEQRWIAFADVNGPVQALAVSYDRTRVYIGGSFTSVGTVAIQNVAVWDRATDTWSALPGSSAIEFLPGGILSLETRARDLFVGGFLRFRDGDPSLNVAMWRYIEQRWVPMGRGLDPSSVVTDIQSVGLSVFVAGDIDSADGIPVRNIAAWNIETGRWDSLGSGIPGSIEGLAGIGDDLYVGGAFASAGGVATRNLARYSESDRQWSSIDTGVGDDRTYVYGLVAHGDRLAVAVISLVNQTTFRGIALVDPATGAITTPDKGVNGLVGAMAARDGEIVVAGDLTQAGDVRVARIARYDALTRKWGALTHRAFHAINGVVRAIVPQGDGFYAAGDFSSAGYLAARNIAYWNGAAWEQLGDGLNGPVFALLLHDDTLYAGGLFSAAGSVEVANIARWSPTTRTWSALRIGLDGPVRALAADSSGRIYAGGEFTGAVGEESPGVIEWSGGGWRPITTSGALDGIVYALATVGGDLYVGGNYRIEGTQDEIIHIGRYARSSGTWTSLGTGVDLPIVALLADGAGVVAGGPISRAGDADVAFVARWDGATWSRVGSGLTGERAIYSIARHGRNLVVGGAFTSDGAAPRFLAVLEGGTWRPLASGTDSTVYALASSGGDLIIGGSFRRAGDTTSRGIAIWHGVTSSTGTEMSSNGIVATIAPNPVGDHAALRVRLEIPSAVTVALVDALGRVATSQSRLLPAGEHIMSLDLTNVVPGAWFARVEVGNRVSVIPVVVR